MSLNLGLSTAITTPYIDKVGSVYLFNNHYTPAPLLSKNYTTTAKQSILLDTLGDPVQPNVTFTVNKDLSFVNGQRVVVTYNDINYFISSVLEYKNDKLKLDKPIIRVGSGTYSNWNIALDTYGLSNPTLKVVTFKYFNNPVNTTNSGRITPLIFELFPIKSVYTYSFIPSKLGTDINKTIYENMGLKNTVQKKNNITLETINYNTNNAQIIFYPNTDMFKGCVFIRSMDTNNLNNYWLVDTSAGLVPITDPVQALRLIELLNDAYKNNISNFITPFSKDSLIVDKYNNYKLVGVGNSIPSSLNKVNKSVPLNGSITEEFIVQSGTNVLEHGKTYAFGWKDGSADTLQPPCIQYDNKGLFPSLYLTLNEKYSNQDFNKIINNIMPFDINLGAKAYPITFTVVLTPNPDACISKDSNFIPSCPYGTQVCPLFVDKNLCYDPAQNQMVTTYFDPDISFCPETGRGINNNKYPYLIDNTRVYFTNDSILPCGVPYVSVKQKLSSLESVSPENTSTKEGFNNHLLSAQPFFSTSVPIVDVNFQDDNLLKSSKHYSPPLYVSQFLNQNYNNNYENLLTIILIIIIFFYITYKNN
jgi:hypothetical protein